MAPTEFEIYKEDGHRLKEFRVESGTHKKARLGNDDVRVYRDQDISHSTLELVGNHRGLQVTIYQGKDDQEGQLLELREVWERIRFSGSEQIIITSEKDGKQIFLTHETDGFSSQQNQVEPKFINQILRVLKPLANWH